ncbi:rust resistance kinase Lr10-like isoform X2 [Rhododendron vialii]|uniref:rust resistance kinase Lr10-like isoform X2 n=1 Tax=Rhododendron vialii TaxID=182163 RepID=UPI00265DB08C|nr:rust resistance kinase Lr10-like isoform X2 [Rhododendron vialii]
MSIYYYCIFFFILRLSTAQGDCTPTTCSDRGPTIRFPFRLKNQPPHCGYLGFDLSCSPNNTDTLLNLPYSVQVLVTNIDYKSQLIHIEDPNNCFPQQLQNLSLSTTPFQFVGYQNNFSLFSCPPSTNPDFSFLMIPCLGGDGREVRVGRDDSIKYAPPQLISCRKMFNVPSVPYEVFDQTPHLQLKWLQPVCGECEAKGKFCRLKRNSTSDEIECFGDLNPLTKGHNLVIAGETLGPFLLLVILAAMFWFYRQKKIKREDNLKIERFLEDYRALKPARYSYADIKKITNQFNEKVGQGGYGTVYKGQLSNDVYVAVKILNSTKENGEDFINEVGIIGTIHHVNVVRLVGYCADGFRRALIYEFLPNDSLETFASSDHRKRSLGWKKLLEIAMGIAKGIEYLHQGCDQQILHFDIKPHNILLDENLNPKITDFGLAKLCSKEQSVVSMTTARGTIGYIAPEVFSRNFGNVSYKSDIYSFGMLLLEVVGGKKNFDVMVSSTNQVYFPEWIYNCLERGEELGIHIQDEGDAKIAKKLAIVGLWCIQWYPVDRPSMHVVIQMLEGDGDTLIKPPNPFASTNPTMTTGQANGRPFTSELEVIVESE